MREAGGTSETGQGSRSEVRGFRNFEPRTLNFGPRLSRMSRASRSTVHGRWLTFSASCGINRSLRHTSCSSRSLRDAVSGLPLLRPRTDSSSVAGDVHADHGHIVDRPPNHHIHPNEIRQWVDAHTHLPYIPLSIPQGYATLARMLTRTEEHA